MRKKLVEGPSWRKGAFVAFLSWPSSTELKRGCVGLSGVGAPAMAMWGVFLGLGCECLLCALPKISHR